MRSIALGIASLVLAGAARAQDYGDPQVLIQFDTMYGVDEAFLGDGGAFRDIPGDDLPWEIAAARGQVTTDGHVQVRVQGLVFADDPAVPPNLVGKNDSPTFRVAVSCEAADDAGNVGVVNVYTHAFRASRSGNSSIDDFVSLPADCVAPVVFVMPSDEVDWFAASGAEI